MSFDLGYLEISLDSIIFHFRSKETIMKAIVITLIAINVLASSFGNFTDNEGLMFFTTVFLNAASVWMVHNTVTIASRDDVLAEAVLFVGLFFLLAYSGIAWYVFSHHQGLMQTILIVFALATAFVSWSVQILASREK